ncbi:MAG: DegT/DnrJ/EryC1/StrS aminotransferase family protein [Cuniculiplasma divulgatum]|nr:MAG: DegT/DnrJ/EryC1/StrS aminotransferase family protein [Cuniculiplasma divulgatum]
MKVPFSRPVINETMINAAIECLRNDRLVGGKSVTEFENNFAEYVGTKHAVAVNSGTAALFLSLKSLGIGENDLVLTQSATFIATANAISQTGAKPIFLDINNHDTTISLQQLITAIKKYGQKIKAILPVHLYGRTGELGPILEVASDFGIPVVEDACQAHGATFKNKKAGSFGELGAFSFYSSKNMTVGGDGGMVTTNNEELAESIRILRNQGSSKENRYKNDVMGYNFRLNSVNASIGNVQLHLLDSWNKRRKQVATIYHKRFETFEKIGLPPADSDDIKSSWHIYSVRIKQREKLINYLKSKNIETGIHYPIPVHLQVPYVENMGQYHFSLENTEKWASENVSLPIYNDITDEELEYVIEVTRDFLGENY